MKTKVRMRYLFWTQQGDPVLDGDGNQRGTNYGPKDAYDIARQLTEKLGYRVLWSDEGPEDGAE